MAEALSVARQSLGAKDALLIAKVLFIYLSIYPSIHIYISESIYLLFYLSIYIYLYRSISIYLSIYLSRSIYLSIYISEMVGAREALSVARQQRARPHIPAALC